MQLIDVQGRTSANLRVVWKPIPGRNGGPSSQSLALDARCHVIMYTGARGPGKTDCQLMRFRKRVGIGYGKFWRGIIFDREYKNLEDLIAKSKRWFPQFNDGCRFLESKGDLKWVWPTGEELLFRAIKKDSDYYNYHGHEYPFIGWNELTKYPTPSLYRKMMSTNRSSFVSPDLSKIPPIPLEVFITTNPHGPGHNWVKREFIDVAPYGTVVRKKYKVIEPGSIDKEIEIEKTQVTIFGSWKENPYLDSAYVATLMDERDESVRGAWLDGNWDIVAGGMFDDVWRRNVHVVPRFVVPRSWPILRCYDHGSTHPFSVGWIAIANGEEATIDIAGRELIWCPPRQTIIRCGEWYGAKEVGTNEGLKLPTSEICRGIVERENMWQELGWFQTKPHAGPADNQIWDVRQVEVETIADSMRKHDVEWIRSNKSAGSRKNGWQLMRDRLWNAVEQNEEPGLYVMDHCVNTINLLPVLPRDEKDPDDVDTDAEDHIGDEMRYGVLHVDKDYARNVRVSYQ